jgi:hypothetical protein
LARICVWANAAQPLQWEPGMTSTTSITPEPTHNPSAPATTRLVSLAVGRRIVNDDVIGRPQAGDPFLAGETVYAHTKLASFRDGFLEHVWKRDGVEVLREVMPIGEGRCWRTWSYHRLESGDYTVEVFAPNGQRLASRSFTAF